MGLLDNIAKNAGQGTVDKVTKETIPAAEQAVERIEEKGGQVVKEITDRATYSATAIIADISNRANGAEIPIDLTLKLKGVEVHIGPDAEFHLSGKIGPLKLNNPADDPTVKPSCDVQG